MTPATIIREAQVEGVRLALSPAGTIKATGDGDAVNRWLAAIREHKAGIIEALKVGAGDTATTAEVIGQYQRDADAGDYFAGRAAAELPKPDPFPDDRRRCTQCLNLKGRTCTIAHPGGLVSANRGYQPMRDVLQRCAGYQPDTHDTDQRSGSERWPGLTDTNGEE